MSQLSHDLVVSWYQTVWSHKVQASRNTTHSTQSCPAVRQYGSARNILSSSQNCVCSNHLAGWSSVSVQNKEQPCQKRGGIPKHTCFLAVMQKQAGRLPRPFCPLLDLGDRDQYKHETPHCSLCPVMNLCLWPGLLCLLLTLWNNDNLTYSLTSKWKSQTLTLNTFRDLMSLHYNEQRNKISFLSFLTETLQFVSHGHCGYKNIYGILVTESFQKHPAPAFLFQGPIPHIHNEPRRNSVCPWQPSKTDEMVSHTSFWRLCSTVMHIKELPHTQLQLSPVTEAEASPRRSNSSRFCRAGRNHSTGAQDVDGRSRDSLLC